MTTIGDNIKTLRTSQGWSQERLARASGVSQTTIDKIEKGHTLRSRYLMDIAVALGVPISTIDEAYKGKIKFIPAANEDTIQLQPHEMPVFMSSSLYTGCYINISETTYVSTLRPRMLDQSPGAYGVYMSLDFMSPELDPGDVALFDDRYPVIVGSTGIFKEKAESGKRRVIGRLEGITDKHFIARCWKFEDPLELDRAEWFIGDRMVGKYSKR
jgi:transcriptional regulator with XRE-family HTH domain